MSDINYLCPQCRTTLAPVTEGSFDTWHCKDGHGVGVTLTETYGHLQEDEIHAIWQAAKSAPASSLKSPALGNPMVAITIVADDDEIKGNKGPASRLVTLDVAPGEQFVWFQVVDLKNMPADLPNPPPSPEEAAKLEQLRQQSIESIAKDADERAGTAGEFGYRVGSKAAALLRMTGFMNRLSSAARARLDKA